MLGRKWTFIVTKKGNTAYFCEEPLHDPIVERLGLTWDDCDVKFIRVNITIENKKPKVALYEPVPEWYERHQQAIKTNILSTYKKILPIIKKLDAKLAPVSDELQRKYKDWYKKGYYTKTEDKKLSNLETKLENLEYDSTQELIPEFKKVNGYIDKDGHITNKVVYKKKKPKSFGFW